MFANKIRILTMKPQQAEIPEFKNRTTGLKNWLEGPGELWPDERKGEPSCRQGLGTPWGTGATRDIREIGVLVRGETEGLAETLREGVMAKRLPNLRGKMHTHSGSSIRTSEGKSKEIRTQTRHRETIKRHPGDSESSKRKQLIPHKAALRPAVQCRACRDNTALVVTMPHA